jgi:glutamate N-acetyltransferase/amino-acid N-acetyltransferase
MNTNLKTISKGTITSPVGFLAGAVNAGIGHNGKLDLAIIYSEQLCTAAAVYTKNRIKASPIKVCQKHLEDRKAQAIVVNSGNANTSNGVSGPSDALEMAAFAADKLRLPKENVLVASTGIIGIPLPMERIRKGIPEIAVSGKGGNDFATAIMTTDSRSKEIALNVQDGDMQYTIGGVAKGAGMIHPDMATMLSFITTDAEIEGDFLQKSLRIAVERSFNMITVDGDTSTNDMVVVMANGMAKNKAIGDENGEVFQNALNAVCEDLAKKIAFDGEGATKSIEVIVERAYSEQEAKLAARTIASSTLVKTAAYGHDPNFGRIIAAIGKCRVQVDEEKLEIYLNGTCVFQNGIPVPFDRDKLTKEMKDNKEITIKLGINVGTGRAVAWGCDLSEEYVTINSAHTT